VREANNTGRALETAARGKDLLGTGKILGELAEMGS
jgi:hypothetical protein